MNSIEYNVIDIVIKGLIQMLNPKKDQHGIVEIKMNNSFFSTSNKVYLVRQQ